MNDCDALLRRVMAQAAALGIPYSRQTDPHVVVNDRAVRRFGCCRCREGTYTIEVARRVAEGPESSCLETLAHELLHTCQGCRDHGKKWKEYAGQMSRAYGYHIARTSTGEELGVEEAREPRYLLRCAACGREFKRYRASFMTEHPERYRCRCGGALIRVK